MIGYVITNQSRLPINLFGSIHSLTNSDLLTIIGFVNYKDKSK